jgi:hypothetical protein
MIPEWLITALQNILSFFVGLFSGLLLTHFVDESKSSLFLKIFITHFNGDGVCWTEA